MFVKVSLYSQGVNFFILLVVLVKQENMMSKPMVAILSRNSRFTSELPGLMNEQFNFLICDEMDDLRDLLRNNQPDAFIADFIDVQGGGHAEDRLIESLQVRMPKMALFMFTAEVCPEVLARRAASSSIEHFLDNEEFDRLVEIICSKTITEENQKIGEPAKDKSQVEEESSEMVLSGITRKFETNTPEIGKMLSELEVAARHNVTILLIGETGSGKTYLAKLIHEVSPRNEAPFLTVACGALPAELIESELFGHVKGAFTSAHADKEGKFLAAGEGTVLLDEIDVLGPEQQVKLLRVIETGEFEPVGSNKTYTSAARLVVASNLDLQPLVEQGKFRPDLYYRLNMLKFEIAPLRQRKLDIAPMTRKLVSLLAKKHSIEIKRIDRSFIEGLMMYPWPGNIRELENVIQRAVIYATEGVLKSEHLPSHIVSGMVGPTNDPSVVLHETTPSASATTSRANLGQQIELTEREIIEQALFRNNFSRTNTAKDLGISRVTLYNKMKKYGMTRK